MCSYAVSRGKPAVCHTIFHATVQALLMHGAGLQLGSAFTHKLNLLTPNPLPAASPVMGGRVLS